MGKSIVYSTLDANVSGVVAVTAPSGVAVTVPSVVVVLYSG